MVIIHTADWHLRYDVPTCRLETQEEWQDYQIEIVTDILEIFKEKQKNAKDKVILVIAGDIFHTPQQPIYWINRVADLLNKYDTSNIYIIAGNHDLPYHNYENEHRSAYGNLIRQKKCSHNKYVSIDLYNFGEELKEATAASIKVEHRLVTDGSDFIPGSITAEDYLQNEMQNYKVALLGDYHHNFAVYDDDRLVLNPGCITIQSANMINYIPKIVLLDTETQKFKWIELKTNANFITNNHLVKVKERDKRITALVEKLKTSKTISLSFEDNVEASLRENQENLDSYTKAVINTIMEEVC
jgi:DNA repair exonuclease SbcCD nuclease subunit